jgi:hypothetical protein
MLRLGNGGASSSPLVSRTSQVVGYGVEEYEQTVLYDVVDGVGVSTTDRWGFG